MMDDETYERIRDEMTTACARKKPLSHGGAISSVTNAREGGTTLNAYICHICSHYHVGHPLTMQRLVEFHSWAREYQLRRDYQPAQ